MFDSWIYYVKITDTFTKLNSVISFHFHTFQSILSNLLSSTLNSLVSFSSPNAKPKHTQRHTNQIEHTYTYIYIEFEVIV